MRISLKYTRPEEPSESMRNGLSRAALLLSAALTSGAHLCAQASLPDAPEPQMSLADPAPGPTALNQVDSTPTGPRSVSLQPGPPLPGLSNPLPEQVAACRLNASTAALQSMSCEPIIPPFQYFLRSERPRPMTPRQKLILAGKNSINPFNILTIVGTSAISVASNPDSAYGPGMRGFARNCGVVFTEGLTSEFFGTFLIPSIVGQDPHFHRRPNASTGRRIAHAFYQVVWTQSDSGRPMFNYATVVGTMADDAVNDLYVPGRELGAGSSAARIGTALATDPIDNLITEFVPDLARHIDFHVVFVQRAINRVALEEGRNGAD